jgi:hypothetical protein
MEQDHHNHLFGQYPTFLGSDINNNLELNADQYSQGKRQS